MKAAFVFRSCAVLAALFISAICVLPASGAENSKKKAGEAPPLFTWDFLWTGSWLKTIHTPDGGDASSPDFFSGGTLYNRGNFALGMPGLDLSFRLLATDKRVLPPAEDDGKAGFNPALGLYHRGNGSRILYGVQSEYGLPARINNVWIRSVPFMETHTPSSRDLKTEPSATDKSETYLYLGLPGNLLPGFDAFTAVALDGERNPAFGGGAGWSGARTGLRLEGFYTKKELAPRNAQSWFSGEPPLPERAFDIYALGLIFYSPWVSFASDWARSDTFAWGKGVYGNFTLRLGNKPWRLSLAGDGAGGRFADRSGDTAGAGFRLAAKGEHFWPRSGVLRVQGNVRAPGLGESFNRGSLSAYFRPGALSAAERKKNPSVIRFSRASLAVSRDARKPEKTEDVLNGTAAFNVGPFTGVFSCALHNLSSLAADNGSLFHGPVFETFDSFKVSGELGWKPPIPGFGIFDLRTRLGYTIRAEKDPVWELAVNSSIKAGKWGRLGLKVASTDFPEKWNYALNWRFEAKLP